MSTKTAKPKSITANGATSAKNGSASNGSSAKIEPRKKSMNERLIEKYGIADSKADIMFLKVWKKIYEAHNSPKS